MLNTEDIERLDRADPLRRFRDSFLLPDGVVYLDGNSLGPLHVDVSAALDETVNQHWRNSLIRGWREHGWLDLPERVGNRIARLVGAVEDSVTLTDTLSLNVVKALSAALDMRKDRRVILSDSGNFPSDLYMAQGLVRALDRDLELVIVEPEEVLTRISEDVAVVMLTEVDYRSARLHDMAKITAATHDAGAISVWDLAHSAGALPIDLSATNVDIAVGCTYKYLNGGPGAPGFIYVAPRLCNDVWPLLCGWMGAEQPFAFELDYAPGAGIRRMRVGTPPVIGLAALDAALSVWDDVSMVDVRHKSCALSDLFIAEVEQRCDGQTVELGSPREAAKRGSHVSFHCEHGFAVMQALIKEGVIGDFREPDNIRFGFAPLYTRYADVVHAAKTLSGVLKERRWDRPAFRQRSSVT